MNTFNILFPVFFMIFTGYLCKRTGWITAQEKEGTKKVVFNILIPLLIFNVLFSSRLNPSAFSIVIYVFAAFVLIYWIGKLCIRWTGRSFAHLSPFLLMTCEGGSVALPLYTSVVGAAYASNTITFDIAGVMLGFVLIPILVARQTSAAIKPKDLILKIITNSFVLAVFTGLLLNVSGIYLWLEQSAFFTLYSQTISMATGSLTGLILFAIGYDFSLSSDTLAPLLKLSILRVATSLGIILGFFLLFPQLMADPIYRIGVFIYFLCPTGFATPLQLVPLHKEAADGIYSSTFLSLYMVITLIAYTLIVTFLV